MQLSRKLHYITYIYIYTAYIDMYAFAVYINRALTNSRKIYIQYLKSLSKGTIY